MSCSLPDSPQRRRLLDDVRQRLFTPARADGAARFGAELELIPLRVADGRPVPIHADDDEDGSLAFLEPLARRRGWALERGPHGAPTMRLRDGGRIAFEPGGQLEYATPPRACVAELVDDLDRVVPPLLDAAADAGVRLVGAGIDPLNPLERARLLLPGARYAAMHRYLAAIGDAGPRMMLQTAAIQANVELGAIEGQHAHLRWRTLNAAAPYLTAIFANSATYAGEDSGYASFRARQWRLLDRRRTGVLGREVDPAAEYLEFALEAGWIFAPDGGAHEPFVEWLLRGQVSLEDWRRHLTTLFPEIRPRGFLEVRCIDALAPEWQAAPLALIAGLLADARSLRAAAEIVGRPDSMLLQDAARSGMRDPRLAGPARELFALALDAGERARVLDGRGLEVGRQYFDAYTARGRAPADDEVGAAA